MTTVLTNQITVFTLVAVCFAAGACNSTTSVGSNSDADTDTDTDMDTDGDTDTDTDTKVLFVNSAVETSGDGASWETAFAEVQEGIDAAWAMVNEGSLTTCEVWVATGTYKPTKDSTGNPEPEDVRTRTILLKPGVALYGGFLGGETSRDQRDIAANETILSGDSKDKANPYDDSYHVVTGSDDALINGFTITLGRAISESGDVSDPNTYGAGMYNVSASPTVADCTFKQNSAQYRGGGMYNESSSPIVTNCRFEGNEASDNDNPNAAAELVGGGGMFNRSSSPIVTNCLFWNNLSSINYLDYDLPLDVDGEGSGGGMTNVSSSPILTNCVFVENEAWLGGGIFNSASSSPILTNSILWANTAKGDADGNQIARSLSTGGSSEPILAYSDVKGGCSSIARAECDEGNIDADPLFRGAATGDLHLLPGSPCIDLGLKGALPSDALDLDGDGDTAESIPVDLDGNDRILGSAVDMGAYESGTGGGDTPAASCPVFVSVYLPDYTDHDGSTWELAFATVQEGIDAAAAGVAQGSFASCEVWTAEGMYVPTEDPTGSVAPIDNRKKTILLKPGAALYGGFTGKETSIEQRDVALYKTTLSGKVGIYTDGRDNVYHVVTGSDDAVIDGFTITDGNADGDDQEGYGAGMLNLNASPTVANCTFENNRADALIEYFPGGIVGLGGGMYNEDASPTVTNCRFSGNVASHDGGGIYSVNASPTVTNCTFNGNKAGTIYDDDDHCYGDGGGLYSESSSSIVTNCIFWGNSACSGAGEIGGEVRVTYSDVEGGFEGTSNINSDPLFANSDADDLDLHLKAESPCIDTGLASALPADAFDLDDDGDTTESVPFDIDSRPRVTGDAVDMGAYEFQP
jgi:parallel beta-helix repeat protein